jgi:hypothetical protein
MEDHCQSNSTGGHPFIREFLESETNPGISDTPSFPSSAEAALISVVLVHFDLI